MATMLLLAALLAGEPAADSTPRIDVAKKQTWTIGQCRYSIAGVELRKSDTRAHFRLLWRVENTSEQATITFGEAYTPLEKATVSDDRGTDYKVLHHVANGGKLLAPGDVIHFQTAFAGLPYAKAKQLEIGVGFGDDAATFVIPRRLFGKPVRY